MRALADLSATLEAEVVANSTITVRDTSFISNGDAHSDCISVRTSTANADNVTIAVANVFSQNCNMSALLLLLLLLLLLSHCNSFILL